MMSIEQRNAQKLYNLINIANINNKNRDIYFFIKCNVKVLLNKIKISSKDLEILSGHMTAFTTELKTSKWDLGHFDAKKYEKFLNDFFDKVDFRKVDTEFMFKCRDLLEISPIKNVLYTKRMEFFDKKLPKIGTEIESQNINNINNKQDNNKINNNLINNSNNTNNYTFINNNINNNTNIHTQKPINQNQPVNPFENMTQSSNPYLAMNNGGVSPYQQEIIINNTNITNVNEINNNNDKILLNSIPKNNQNPVVDINSPYNYGYTKKIIPEEMKSKILKELKFISDDIVNNKIDNCKQHSIAALLYFKQIFPE